MTRNQQPVTRSQQPETSTTMKKTTILSILLLIGITTMMHAQDYRYVKSIFPSVTFSYDIVYGTADYLNPPYIDETNTTEHDLIMDMYQPHGDNFTMRPAIIFTHGGGFFSGSRTVDDMNAFCDTFARKGYVTVTIDYRQGVEVYDNADMHYNRAAYRGLQDGRKIVRLLRAIAGSYGIDPDKIYFLGNSAGAFIGLNALYMDEDELPEYVGAYPYTNPLPPYNTIIAPDLGNPDIGGNLNIDGSPNAVIGLWGGVGDTLTIEADNNQNVFMVHGTADDVVPFTSGPPFGLTNLSPVYGSFSMSIRLQNEGIPAAETYFVEGVGHEFYGADNGNWSNGTGGNAYWDTIVQRVTRFLWQQHKPTANFDFGTDNYSVSFNNTSQGSATSLWDFGDGNTSTSQDPVHTYASDGTYEVILYIENETLSWDTANAFVTVPMTSIPDDAEVVFNIYPNPTRGLTQILFKEIIQEGMLRLYDLSGHILLEKKINQISQTFLDLSEYNTGLYLISVFADDQIYYRKIILK